MKNVDIEIADLQQTAKYDFIKGFGLVSVYKERSTEKLTVVRCSAKNLMPLPTDGDDKNTTTTCQVFEPEYRNVLLRELEAAFEKAQAEREAAEKAAREEKEKKMRLDVDCAISMYKF